MVYKKICTLVLLLGALNLLCGCSEMYERHSTGKGIIHVWIPNGYNPTTAGTVIYVHGYHDTVDSAWEDHKLKDQFKQSGRNALFVAIEAPSSNQQKVSWPRLDILLEKLTELGWGPPRGPVIAIGHSGGYRTIKKWVTEPRLTQIILLDAMYGGYKEFSYFASLEDKQVIIVSKNTVYKGRDFKLEYPDTLHTESKYSHMGIVTRGKVIPELLRDHTSLIKAVPLKEIINGL